MTGGWRRGATRSAALLAIPASGVTASGCLSIKEGRFPASALTTITPELFHLDWAEPGGGAPEPWHWEA